MTWVGSLHDRLITPRRANVLVRHLAATIPPAATVLDVGCGDGWLARSLQQQRPDLHISGIDTLVRPSARLPVISFDGQHIPFPDQSFDVALFMDVLHHTDNPLAILREAARVTVSEIIVKDHLADGVAARPLLRLMDYVGNAHHGVSLPHTYLTKQQWNDVIARAGLRVAAWESELGLYPPPLSWVFERSLHFLAELVPWR